MIAPELEKQVTPMDVTFNHGSWHLEFGDGYDGDPEAYVVTLKDARGAHTGEDEFWLSLPQAADLVRNFRAIVKMYHEGYLVATDPDAITLLEEALEEEYDSTNDPTA